MMTVVHLLAEYAFFLYIACFIGILFFFFRYLRARQKRKEALFGLELEIADKRQTSLRIYMLVILLVAALIAFIQNVIEPGLPIVHTIAATATPDIFRTPPPTFTNITPSPTATLTPTLALPTVTPAYLAATSEVVETPAEEETITATPLEQPPQASDALCAITQPADGSTIEGEVTIIGSASADNFYFFKLEAYGPETNGVWASVIGEVANKPVVNGVLGTANFSGWAPGGYSLRIVIVDSTSNEVAGCFISINVAGQP